jgi:hypothetical protein
VYRGAVSTVVLAGYRNVVRVMTKQTITGDAPNAMRALMREVLLPSTWPFAHVRPAADVACHHHTAFRSPFSFLVALANRVKNFRQSSHA